MKAAWTQVTPSEHPWEREALAFLKERLLDFEPYRAWSNFEFVTDGAVSEVDVLVLVLARKAIFLVEVKELAGPHRRRRWYLDLDEARQPAAPTGQPLPLGQPQYQTPQAAAHRAVIGGRRMSCMEPGIETSNVDELGEPLLDMYGTPWGQVLSGVDLDVLTVSGAATVRIPAGTPDVE